MNPRKNVLSYIIWLVFSVYMLLIMTAYSFAVVNNSVYSRYITQTYQKALLFLGVVAVFAFIFVGVKTNAKVYSVEFTPKGYNYIDPYNFYYLPINKDVHGYVNSIREFNVSNVDEFVLKVKNPDNIEIIFLEG